MLVKLAFDLRSIARRFLPPINLWALDSATVEAAGKLLIEAADSVVELERVTRERDIMVHVNAKHEHNIANITVELDAAKAQRDAARTTPEPVHGPIYEQVKAQILDDVHAIFRANGFSTSKIRADAARPRPRYAVSIVHGYGPGRQSRTWWNIVDRSTPTPVGFKRVGIAYDATDARHIAEMFETRYGET